jgi:phosphocarrier protein HPr
MQEKELNIINQLGLHARAAAIFVQYANKYQSSVRVAKEGEEVDGKSIIGLLTLAAECGSLVCLRTEGPDEQAAMEDLAQLVGNKFLEPQ